MRVKRKSWVGGGIVVAAVMAGGVTAALWTASGNGTGRSSSMSAQTLTVDAATGAADLYPGFTAGDLYFEVSNPNPYPVTFTAFTVGTVTSSDPTACPSTNVTVDSTGSISLPVAAGASAAPSSIADVVTMLSSAPDGCQNKSFTISVTLTGSQT